MRFVNDDLIEKREVLRRRVLINEPGKTRSCGADILVFESRWRTKAFKARNIDEGFGGLPRGNVLHARKQIFG
jgi:hypothetical protein